MDLSKTLLTPLLCGVAMLSAIGTASAQSSGNIASSENQTVCQIDSTTGGQSCFYPSNGNALTPCPGFSSTTPLFTSTIQTSSGSGNGLVITPSIDVGLFTDTVVSGSGTLTGSNTQETGVMVTVTVDGKPALPGVKAGSPPGATGVVYDQRFQELSASNIQCGGGGACDIGLILSSMSAHSFNFLYPNVTQGTHTIKVFATLTNPPNTTDASACIGPATMTAIQVKAFSQNF
jgi:hypothetical protein